MGHGVRGARRRRAAANRRLSDYVINLAATWGPGSKALKRRLLLWSICALCPTPRLIDALGLQDDHKTTPRWFRVALKAVMYARGWAVGALLPPRPTWWPGTLLRGAAGAGEPSFGRPAGCRRTKSPAATISEPARRTRRRTRTPSQGSERTGMHSSRGLRVPRTRA